MSTLFIGGLSPVTDEIEIAKLILGFGKINTIKIVRDKFSGKSKGFAFVDMQNESDAIEAVAQLDGELWNDNNLTVKIQEEQSRKTAKPNFQKKPFDPQKYAKVSRSAEPVKPKRPRRGM